MVNSPIGKAGAKAWFIPLVSAGLTLVGLAYLVMKCLMVRHAPGYDYAYVWTAGRVWLDGLDPYGPDYARYAAEFITKGHVPDLWVYPPGWFAFAAFYSQFDVLTANLLWNLTGVVLAVLSSALIVWAYLDVMRQERGALAGNWVADLGFPLLFSLHFLAAAVFEVTAIALSVGQTSMFIYFGLALLLWAAVRQRSSVAAIGLAIVMLKPQIGGVIAVVLLCAGAWGWRTVALGALLSVLAMVPALVINPASPMLFLHNLTQYDGFTIANLPQAMTGVRILAWALGDVVLSNPASGAITLLVALVLALWVRRSAWVDGLPLAWMLVGLTSAVIGALAPLHVYDQVVILVVLPVVFHARRLWLVLGLVGAGMLLRADGLGRLTGLYDPEIGIFEGSLLATIGAILVLFAMTSATFQLVGQMNGAGRRPGPGGTA